jgi:hypothetical protein
MQSKIKRAKHREIVRLCIKHSYPINRCSSCQRAAVIWCFSFCNIKSDCNLDIFINERINEQRPSLNIMYSHKDDTFIFDSTYGPKFSLMFNGTDEEYIGFIAGLLVLHNMIPTKDERSILVERSQRYKTYKHTFEFSDKELYKSYYYGTHNLEEFLHGVCITVLLCKYYNDPVSHEAIHSLKIRRILVAHRYYDFNRNDGKCKLKIIQIF